LLIFTDFKEAILLPNLYYLRKLAFICGLYYFLFLFYPQILADFHRFKEAILLSIFTLSNLPLSADNNFLFLF